MGLELKNVTKKFKTIEGENILFEDKTQNNIMIDLV